VLLAGPVPIDVPSLRDRASELPRIVDEYAAEAIKALHARAGSFTDRERDWVMANAATSLDEIEKATLRLVALHLSFGVRTAAAERLGMAPVSLARWLDRRASLGVASAEEDRVQHRATS